MFERPFTINLALQGGGAHGAFTWGVLDRLLEVEGLRLGWVSGTSAGAVNAAALASGLAVGGEKAGRTEARARLRAVWEAIEKAGVPDFAFLNPLLTRVASLWSPYEFNPLGFDPLRRLLTDTIDFDAIRNHSPVELLIAATDVATGRARLFQKRDMTVDVVLASACLPTLHHAVTIEGRAYWDGGFSANPDLVTLATRSPIGDTLIVKLAPLVVGSMPRQAADIAGHVNRLTFNAPFLRDVATIEAARDAARGHYLHRGTQRLARHRFHLIDASRYTSALKAESKGKPEAGMLKYLFGAGRAETEKWLALHQRDVGKRSTVEMGKRFLGVAEADETPVALPAGDAGGKLVTGAPGRVVNSIP